MWPPIASTTNITKLQTIQKTHHYAIVSGCRLDTNIQHLHDEIKKIVLLHTHLKLLASQIRQKS